MLSLKSLSGLIIIVSLFCEFWYDPFSEKVVLLSLIFLYALFYLHYIKITNYLDTTIGLCINIIVFSRLFLLPILIIIDSEYLNHSTFGYGPPNSTFFLSGVLFTFYENLFVGVYLRKVLKGINSNFNREDLQTSILMGHSNKALLFFIFVLFALSLLQSGSYDNRQLVFALDENFTGEIEVGRGSTLKTIASLASNNFLLLLPVPFAAYFAKKYLSSYSNLYYLMLLMVLMCGYGLFITNSSRASLLIPILTTFVFVRDLIPWKKKQTTIVIGSFFFTILIITTIWKSYTRTGVEQSTNLDDFVEMLELYFVGISNVGKAYYAKLMSGVSFRFDFLLNDFFHSFPILSHYTNDRMTSVYFFQQVFGGRTDQIMPAVGNGMFYFGYLLSPLVSIFQIQAAVFTEKIAKRSADVPMYIVFTYGTIMLVYGCFSCIQIFTQKLIINFSLAALIVYLNRKKI